MDYKQISGREFPRFSAIKTFFRMPYVEMDADYDVGIVGVPYDGGVSYRPGARFGPTRIREASSLGRGFNWSRGEEVWSSKKVADLGLAEHFVIDSCGTAPFNVGKSPDPRALLATKKFGYEIQQQIARQVTDEDFTEFDFIIPMDRKNLMTLNAWKPADFNGELESFMQYHPNSAGNKQIPDPYHEGEEAFYPIITTLEQASDGLIEHIRAKFTI